MSAVLLRRRSTSLLPSLAGFLGRGAALQSRSCSGSSAQAVISAKQPFQVELKQGKGYAWCACGHSRKQPFCDGSHKRNAPKMSPLRFKAEETKEAWLCGCKCTKNPPYCDGTHKEGFVQNAELHSQPQK
nr:CDGSH iron-sulfur domain-containing protein 3, mitochondrial isoform X1 [Anolis sagrei ordinatus]